MNDGRGAPAAIGKARDVNVAHFRGAAASESHNYAIRCFRRGSRTAFAHTRSHHHFAKGLAGSIVYGGAETHVSGLGLRIRGAAVNPYQAEPRSGSLE